MMSMASYLCNKLYEFKTCVMFMKANNSFNFLSQLSRNN